MITELVWMMSAFFVGELVLWSVFSAFLSSKPAKVRPNGYPSVSVIIPAWNEGSVIREKLSNVRSLDYAGKIEAIVVDDRSDDDTIGAVNEVAREWPAVRLVKHADRKGQAAAFNSGVAEAKNDFVLLSDADSFLDRDALKNAVSSWREGTVVIGRIRKIRGGRGIAARLNELGWLFTALRQSAEGQMDSTLPAFTPFTLMKRADWPKLNEDSVANDLNLALKARRQGLRVVSEPSATLELANPTAFEGIYRQKSRHVSGGVKELLKNAGKGFGRSWFGLLILPRFVYHTILKQFVALGVLAGCAIVLFMQPGQFLQIVLCLAAGITFSNLIQAAALVRKWNYGKGMLALAAIRPFLQLSVLTISFTAMFRRGGVLWRKV
ncbi:MAG: glycosyltransferase [Candidatus Aenigmatarchaeota archaeon]